MEVGENKIKCSVSDISKTKIGIHFLIKILDTFILFDLDLKVCFPVLKKSKYACWYSGSDDVYFSAKHIKVLVFIFCKKICVNLYGIFMYILDGACGVYWRKWCELCQ